MEKTLNLLYRAFQYVNDGALFGAIIVWLAVGAVLLTAIAFGWGN